MRGEVFALMALFVCESGLQRSRVELHDGEWRPGRRPQHFDDPVHLVDMDKPRRGADARFFSNAFAGERAVLWDMAVSLTQPARETLATLGHPTDRSLYRSRLNEGVQPTRQACSEQTGQDAMERCLLGIRRFRSRAMTAVH